MEKNLHIIKDAVGEYWEELHRGVRVVYKGKEFNVYDIDKNASTILLFTGNEENTKYGFVKEDVSFRWKGKYKYRMSYNYYKEINTEEAEDKYYVNFWTVYKGMNCTLDRIPRTDINNEEIVVVVGDSAKEKEEMLKMGFKVTNFGDNAWDSWTGYSKIIKRDDAELQWIREEIRS